MKAQLVKGGMGYAWCCLVGMLGCSGESAVVGGIQSQPVGGEAGASAQPDDLGKVTRLLTHVSDGPECLPRPLPIEEDGTAACKVFTASADASCSCDAPNRAPVTDAIRAAVREKARTSQFCGEPDAPACADLCVCEDLEASGDSLNGCLSGDETDGDGWCYVSPPQGIGTLDISCEGPQARLRFLGSAAFTASEIGYLACSEASEGAQKKRPLGAVCVPSDERNPAFSGFRWDEVTVDTGATDCASGTCLVEGFQGRVSCPLGSGVSGGGDGACTLPGSNERVLVKVAAQLVARPPSLAATCSCRCAGPGDGPFCTCNEAQDCVPLVSDLGLPGDPLAGSYCVPRGAVTELPSQATCDADPEQCTNRPF